MSEMPEEGRRMSLRHLARPLTMKDGQICEMSDDSVGQFVQASSVDEEVIKEQVREALSKDTLMKETIEVLAQDNKLLRARLAEFEARLEALERERFTDGQ